MLRSSLKQASDARFLGRTGVNSGNVNQIDASNTNGYGIPWRNAADTADIYGIAIDSQNNLRLGDAVNIPLRNSAKFYMAANAGLVTQTFFVAPVALNITGVTEILATLGTIAGASVTVTHEYLASQAPGGGTPIITAPFGLTSAAAAANAIQNGTLAAPYQINQVGNTPAQGGTGIIHMNAGDRLSVLFAGTLTTAAGLEIEVTYQPGGVTPHAVYVMNGAGLQVTSTVFTANRPMTVAGVTLIASAPETATGTATFTFTKDTGTTAPGGGTSVLAATVNLKSGTLVANTPVTPALTATAATLSMNSGDRLAATFAGSASLTALAGFVAIVWFAPQQNVRQVNYSVQANGTLGTNTAFFTADRDYQVNTISGIWSTAGGSGCVVAVTADSGTTAPGSGTVLQTDNTNTGFAASGTANTVNWATMAAAQTLYLRKGDRLSTKNAGTLGSLAGLEITCLLTAV